MNYEAGQRVRCLIDTAEAITPWKLIGEPVTNEKPHAIPLKQGQEGTIFSFGGVSLLVDWDNGTRTYIDIVDTDLIYELELIKNGPGDYTATICERTFSIRKGKAIAEKHASSGVRWSCVEGNKEHFTDALFTTLGGLKRTLIKRVPKYIGRENQYMRVH